LFRLLWAASVVSNVRTWMQNGGGAWLMTELTPSPVLVALMQTATSLPIFLAGLPAKAPAISLTAADSCSSPRLGCSSLRAHWAD
jgi:hypothetical protein